MGKIVAGIGTSHVPSVGPAFDGGKGETDTWRPLFEPYARVKTWLKEEVRPDVAIVVYNDHGTDFFFDKVPTFAVGLSDRYPIGDEGFGPRPLPPVLGDAEFSGQLIESLVHDEFDLTVCQEMTMDHGILVPLPMLFESDPDWDVKVVPLEVNVLQHPLPTSSRCFQLGQAIRRAVEQMDEDVRVVIVGTGGMSHQLHGERFGHLNSDFDQYFLDTIRDNPQKLVSLDQNELMRQAGAEAVELIMWLIMRGALTEDVVEVHRNYYAPMTTGMGLTALVDAPPSSSTVGV
jgi:protocatechuate 4,5-dioxygenase beta chain